MTTTDETRDLVLRYWKSWQTGAWDDMRECLGEQLLMGGLPLSREKFVEMCEQGSPWQGIELIASVFSPGQGALLYEGTITKTGERIRVGEFVNVEDGKIVASVSCFGDGVPPQ